MQVPVSAAEHLVDGPPDDRSEHCESRFDLNIVSNDAAARIIEQGAFVPPDTVQPSRRGLTEATLVRQGDQFNSMAVHWDDAEQQLPKYLRLRMPWFGIEVCAVGWVSHPNERRNLAVHATDRARRRPDLCAVGPHR